MMPVDNENHPMQSEDVEALCAQELNSMSIEERERSYEDLHGTEPLVVETPEFIAERLDALERAILDISSKEAYMKAEHASKEYVQSRKFRLPFLRAENFNPRKAAQRLVQFLEGKLQFFGEDKLAKPILLSDLSKDDRAALKSGNLQLLPSRDRSGRVVLCDFQAFEQTNASKNTTITNMIKAFIYLLLCAAEDEENQKRGIVVLVYQMARADGIRSQVSELAREAPKVFQWAPIKVCGAHVCWENPQMRALGHQILVNAGSQFRSRCRIHEGSHSEVLYSLMTFGIPVELFPLSADGTIKRAPHNKWLTRRKVKEQELRSTGSFSGIDLPARFDVLIGKGKPIQQHAGNYILRSLVDSHMEEYSSTRKGNKGMVIRKVLQAVTASSGRFLSKDSDGWWFAVSDNDARDKVSKTFLTAGTKLNKDRLCASSGSSTNEHLSKKQKNLPE